MRGGRRIPADGHEFRRDADGDLFRRKRANLEPHRCVNAFELVCLIALVLQRFVHRQNFAFAADHAHVARFRTHRPSQNAHVFLVAARDDHQVTRRIGMNLFESFFVARVNLLRYRKALFVREGLAVIHHADAESCRAGRLRHRGRNMPPAEQIQHGLRQNRLDKNFQRSSHPRAPASANSHSSESSRSCARSLPAQRAAPPASFSRSLRTSPSSCGCSQSWLCAFYSPLLISVPFTSPRYLCPDLSLRRSIARVNEAPLLPCHNTT